MLRTIPSFAFLVSAFTLLGALPLTAAHATTYSLQDIGTDGDDIYNGSVATDLSENGYISGYTGTSYFFNAVIWQNNVLTDLPLIPGFEESAGYAQAVNDSGVVVGNAESESEDDGTAFIYQNGATSALTVPNEGDGGAALGVNNAGQIVGRTDTGGKPFEYQSGATTILPLLAGTVSGVANRINNASTYEAVGTCTTAFDSNDNDTDYATLWKNGVAYKLGSLGGPNSEAYGVNDQGYVVGQADTNQKDDSGNYIPHAFLWSPSTANSTSGTMQDLGVIGSGNTTSTAVSINNANSVVGSCGSGSTTVVFIWTSAAGMQNLLPMVASVNVVNLGKPDGYSLTSAAEINNQGQIAANFFFYHSDADGNFNEGNHGCLLTPSGGTTTSQIKSLSYSPTSVVAGTNSTGTFTLTSAAPTGGANVTVTTDGANPTVWTMAAGAVSATYPQDTSFMTAGSHTMAAAYGGKSATATLTVTSNSSLPKPTSISYSPSTVAPGGSTTGTVKLSAAAPTGGAKVAIVENGVYLGSISVNAGNTGATFSYTVPGTAGTYTEAAVYNGGKASTTLTVSSATSPTLSSIAFNPTSVTAGANSTGTVTLSAAAPTGGAVVDLESDSNDVVVPDSVTVSAGAKTATFTAQSTTGVTSAVTATVSATYKSVTKTATLAVNPAATSGLKSVTLSPTSTVGGSAATTGNRVYWNGNAPANETVTLKSSNTGVATVPSSVTISSGSSSHLFTITTSSVTSSTNVTITATSGGVSETATLTVTPAAATTGLESVTLSPTSTTGSTSTTANRVHWNGNAPADETVTLKSSNTAVATVPSSVTISSGSSSHTFTITTASVSVSTNVTITATAGGVSQTATLTVTPAASAGLKSVTLSPTSTVGGSAATTANRVYWNGNAPANETVTLKSSNASVATVPSSVTISSGSSSHPFTITTKSVTSSTNVTITATCGGVSQTATLTVIPASTTVTPKSVVCNPSPAYSSGYSSLTVTLSGAAPTGGTSVSITLNGSAFYSGTVAAGQSSLVIGVNWGYTASAASETFVATANGKTATTTVTLEPTSVTLKSYSFSPSTVASGGSSTATVTLSAAAPAGGAVVFITYNGSAHYNFTIPAGSTSGTYTQPGGTVSSTTAYTYVAAYNDTTKSATQTVTP